MCHLGLDVLVIGAQMCLWPTGELLGVVLPNVINRLFPEHVSPSGPVFLQVFFSLCPGRQMRAWLPTSGSHPQAHSELVTPHLVQRKHGLKNPILHQVLKGL